MGVYEVVQRIFPFAFPILWFCPALVLLFRFWRKQAAYLRRLPPVDRYTTLDMYWSVLGAPKGTFRRLQEAMWCQQDDAELEQLRREVLRSYGLLVLWGFGFPILTFGVITLLILTGHPPAA